MNTSCSFCGMPPLDGEPCCNGNYKRKVMRKADRTIRERDTGLATLRALLAESRQKHTYCEDSRYSCPKAEGVVAQAVAA